MVQVVGRDGMLRVVVRAGFVEIVEGERMMQMEGRGLFLKTVGKDWLE